LTTAFNATILQFAAFAKIIGFHKKEHAKIVRIGCRTVPSAKATALAQLVINISS
jgi:hypothetical protein